MTEQTIKRDINISHIILWFLNFEQSPEDITSHLGLTPTKTAIKGQEYSTSESLKSKRFHKFSIWEFEWKVDSNKLVGDLAEIFINEIIKPRVNEIKMLADSIDAEFKIVQYYYDGYNPGYHLTVDNMKTLTEANLELDIDTYCLSRA